VTENAILFTRWPEPGKAKTRLAPALGPEGAANLHRRLTEHALAGLRACRDERGAEPHVYFAGHSAARFRDWLGTDLAYRRQSTGDLGVRLRAATTASFAGGARRVIVTGSDCPGVTASLLSQAFRSLAFCDLVLGPATDGGYYLIGMNKPHEALFSRMPWGTEDVFEETRRRARTAGLRVALLPPLADIDRPADLPVWHAAQRHPAPAAPRLSVVIPALEEPARVEACLASVEPCEDVEAVVVHGAGDEQTPARANRAGALVVPCGPGRGRQMNAGAAVAAGAYLVFLHADTRLPAGWRTAVEDILGDSDVSLGAFRLGIDNPGRALRAVEWLVDLRARWWGLPYGDQALFLRRTVFEDLGGYRDWPLLEDLDLVRRARRLGRVRTARSAVATAADRWTRLGVWRTTWTNQLVLAGYALGVSPARLARWYRCAGDRGARVPPSTQSEAPREPGSVRAPEHEG